IPWQFPRQIPPPSSPFGARDRTAGGLELASELVRKSGPSPPSGPRPLAQREASSLPANLSESQDRPRPRHAAALRLRSLVGALALACWRVGEKCREPCGGSSRGERI